MRLPVVVVAAFCFAWPAAARAETCSELHESCLEDCHIDHGLAKEREKLTKCVKRCQDRFDDCQDLRQEEHRNHVELEKAPEERKHTSDPVEVQKDKEERPTDVRPAVEDSDDDSTKGRNGKTRASPPPDDPPPTKARPKKVENDPPPPVKKKEEPPKKKQQDFPDSKKSDDDWSKEK